MKKLILIVLAIFAISAVYMTINVELNMDIRFWFKSHLEKDQVIPTEDISVLATKESIFENTRAAALSKEKDAFYIPLEWLKEMGYTYHFDEEENLLNIVGYRNFFRIGENGATIVNDKAIQVTIDIINEDGQRFIQLDALLSFDEAGQVPYKLQINSQNAVYMVYYHAQAFGNANISETKGVYLDASAASQEGIRPDFVRLKSILTGDDLSEETSLGDRVFAYETDLGVFYTLTEEGNLGYVNEGAINLSDDFDLLEVAEPQDRQEIRMVWEYVYRKTTNPKTITNLTGINVVSPTWYELIDSEGNFSDKSSEAYTTWAHDQGMQIWPLITNGFDPDLTHEFLESTDSRQRLINAVVEMAIAHDYDGINIDFENVYLEDRDALSHFINELSWYLDQYEITLSMDVTVIAESDNWSKFYDRQTLGKIVDYLIVMTYDEHWDSSPVSGPVASYDWVALGLTRIKALVPSHKIIMGIPLYTRVWEETVDETVEGGIKVSANAIGISEQNALISEKDLILTWLEEDRLYFTSYIEDGAVHKIWVENLETILEKIRLSKELELGGYAFWRRGLEEENFYTDLINNLE